jgi:methylated-DNA-[protein]-cysteine S-methyltransferase
MPQSLISGPFGLICIHWCGETLLRVDLDPEDAANADSLRGVERMEPPEAIRRQLTNYFAQPNAAFSLTCELGGTPFQQRVWAHLRTIPAGETRTYGEVARVLGSAPRAVGQACRSNPCPIVVPCHRVVALRGLGGFAGDTSGRRLAVKRWLLRHEGAIPADGGLD